MSGICQLCFFFLGYIHTILDNKNIYTSLTTTVTTQEKTSIEQSQVLVDNAVQTEKPNNSLYHNVSINLGEISFLISQFKILKSGTLVARISAM